MTLAHSPAAHTQPGSVRAGYSPADTGWGVGGKHVVAALRGLTRAERRYVEAGYVGGEPMPSTVRSLQHKAMFYLHIDSPNGRCGIMRLTPLGENVRRTIAARKATTAPEAGAVGTTEGREPKSPTTREGADR